MHSRKQFWYAFAMFVGTIIGVGLFGLPYVGAKAGFPILLAFFVIVAALAITINLFYASVAVHTKGLHRLPGYAGQYLGRRGRRVAFIVKTFAIFGALLAYLIVGGQFVADLLGGPVILYTFLFFILGSFLIWRDQKSVGPIELILLVLFLLVIVFLFVTGFDKINPGNLSDMNWRHFFAPYGVVLFSLWGTSIIPEVKEVLQGDFNKIRKVVIGGILTCVVVSILFSWLVVGISGPATTDDGLSGLQEGLGTWVLRVGYFFGIITTFTSFIALGLTVKKIFWYDYGLHKRLGWALACFIPLGLYVLGLQNFIDVISITGAVMLGIDGILVTMTYLKFRKITHKTKMTPHYLKLGSAVIILLLATGVLLELLYYFKII